MKILFLDIDGVLNDHEFCEIAQSNSIKPECVAHLNKIIEETDCKVVISSAWRYMIHMEAMTLLGFEYLLRTFGVAVCNRLIGYTETDEVGFTRSEQILKWLKDKEYFSYVVLDDWDFGFKMRDMPFVQTDPDFGLKEEDVQKAIEILNKEE